MRTGRFRSNGARPEVLVHRVEAGEHGAEVLGADREHRREADRRVHRVAAADPVPEPEHVGGVDAELRDLGGVGRHGDEVLRDRALVAERPPAPTARRSRAFVIVSSVVNVFDDTMKSVSAGSRSRVASTKSVPSTFETKRNVMSRSL